ncbi:MAG: beta strand repeat-containing protein [Planctomycetaceae bacterium]
MGKLAWNAGAADRRRVPAVGRAALGVVLVALVASSAEAVTYYWAGATNASMGTAGNWSTSPSTVTGGVVPSATDDTIFNIDANNASSLSVSLGAANRTAQSQTFKSTGATTFIRSSSGTSSTTANLTIGTGGITVNAGAGAVTYGATDQRPLVRMAGSFAITNNSSSAVNFLETFEPGSSLTGLVTLTIQGSGTGGVVFTNAINNNSTTGTLALIVNTATDAVTQLKSANTFTGGVTLTQGVLGIGSSSALGANAIAVNGGAVASMSSARTLTNAFTIGGNFTLGGQGQSITLNGGVDFGGATRTITLGNSATIGGAVSNGGLILNGSSGGNARRLTLSGSNTYAAGTTVSSGTLLAGSVAAFGSGGVTVGADGSLDLNSLAIANAITNNGGTILNAGSYAGTQTLLASATYSALSGASTLNVGSNGRAKLTGSIAGTIATLAGGTAELASGGSLTQASVANAGRIIFSGTADDTLAASFTGAGAFSKESASILALTGSSFFGAGTQITAGGLLVTGSVGGGAVSVAGGASIGGAGRIGANLNLQSGANFNFNASSTLTVGGTTTFGGSFGIANILGVGSSTPDGTYTLISGNIDFTNVTNVGLGNAVSLGGGKSAYLQQGSLQLVVVPEPASLAILCSAAAAVVVYKRRRV